MKAPHDPDFVSAGLGVAMGSVGALILFWIWFACTWGPHG